jgi:hypothetical protein
MSSYAYRERDREWDDYSRPSDHRGSYSVKRYVYPTEDDRDRERELVFRREEPSTGDRELVIRRRTEPHDDYEPRREYRRDYERMFPPSQLPLPSHNSRHEKTVIFLDDR